MTSQDLYSAITNNKAANTSLLCKANLASSNTLHYDAPHPAPVSRLLGSASDTRLIFLGLGPLSDLVIKGPKAPHNEDGRLCHVQHLFSVWLLLGTSYIRMCWSSCPAGESSSRVHFEGAIILPVPAGVRRCFVEAGSFTLRVPLLLSHCGKRNFCCVLTLPLVLHLMMCTLSLGKVMGNANSFFHTVTSSLKG